MVRMLACSQEYSCPPSEDLRLTTHFYTGQDPGLVSQKEKWTFQRENSMAGSELALILKQVLNITQYLYWPSRGRSHSKKNFRYIFLCVCRSVTSPVLLHGF